jgi:hypothetical protein
MMDRISKGNYNLADLGITKSDEDEVMALLDTVFEGYGLVYVDGTLMEVIPLEDEEPGAGKEEKDETSKPEKPAAAVISADYDDSASPKGGAVIAEAEVSEPAASDVPEPEEGAEGASGTLFLISTVLVAGGKGVLKLLAAL